MPKTPPPWPTPSPGRARVLAVLARRDTAYPVIVFLALAYLLTWALLPLTRISIAFSLLALCGPAVAAVITATLWRREELAGLWRRTTQWRAGGRWYLLALLLPLLVSGLRSGMEYVLGAPGPIRFQPISTLNLIVFALIAGEEIGWRGFALPHLADRVGWLRASLIIGVLWAVWHLPLFHMAGMPQYGTPFLPYIGYTIALSVILSVLTLSTAGSVVIATLFHGAVNTFGIVNAGTGLELRGWSNAVCYGLAACVVGALAAKRGVGPSLEGSSRPP
jgi:membrane protease YdiL (CAAX protease family)